jgi:hypothetical protein
MKLHRTAPIRQAAAVTRRALPLVTWVGLLLALIGAMLAAGHGSVGAPPWSDPGGWSAWASARGAPGAALAIVRVAVLVVASWLLVVTVVALAMAATRRGRDIDIAEVLGLPIVRRVVHGALGLGLAGAAAAGGAGLGGSRSGHEPIPVEAPAGALGERPPALVRLGPAGTAITATASPPESVMATTSSVRLASTTSLPVATTTSIPTATTTSIPTTPFAAASTAVTSAAVTPAVTEQSPTAPAGAAEPAMWTVQPGDHLWSIARRVLEHQGWTSVGDERVTPYWRVLVAANHDRLPVPDNPDLLFPGDRLVVPPVPSAG